jgi:hypothetical protein
MCVCVCVWRERDEGEGSKANYNIQKKIHGWLTHFYSIVPRFPPCSIGRTQTPRRS